MVATRNDTLAPEVHDDEDEASSSIPSSTGTGTPLDWPRYQPGKDGESDSVYRRLAGGTGKGKEDKKAAASPKELSKAENAGAGGATAAAALAGGVTGGIGGGIGGFVKGAGRILFGTRNRKIATGTSGVMVGGIVGLILALAVGSGPLEFIHLAEIMLGSHFGHFNAASDTRVGRVLLDSLDGKVDVGNTRLNWLWGEVGIKNNVLATLADRGVTPEYSSLKLFKGFNIDITKIPDGLQTGAGSAGGDPKVQLSEITGLPADSFVETSPGIFHVDATGFFGDNTAIKGMMNLDKFSGIAGYIRTRVLIKYSAAGRFHVFRKLQLKATQKLSDLVNQWKTDLQDFIKTGTGADTATLSGASEEEPGANGKPTDVPVPGQDGAPSEAQIKSVLSDPKAAAGAAGIVALLVAVICMLNIIRENIGVIRFAQVIGPMMRIATTYVSAGSQIQSGQDIQLEEVDALANQLSTKDPKTGKEINEWSDATPIESETGGTGGVDLDSATKQAFDGVPGWLAWTNNSAVGALCSGVGQVIAGVGSVVIGIISGEIVSTVVGIIVGLALGPVIIDHISQFLAGNAIDVNATGAELGNYIDYGSRLSANQVAVQGGGVALTNQQVAVLNAEQTKDDAQQFHSYSLAYRIFNPDDYRTVVGNMIDQLNITSFSDILTKFGDIPSIVGSLFSIPARLLSSTVHAAAVPYQYPFPEFGFSQTDLDNKATYDPVANADAVNTLLNNNNQNGEPDYIGKALDCFGVQIAMGPQGWDAVPSTNPSSNGQDRTYGVDVYDDQNYSQPGCIDPFPGNESSWLRIRLFILDTTASEGFACYMGDDTSCTNGSFNG